MNTKEQKECHCIVKHAITSEERKIASDRLEVAKDINDIFGITLAVMALTGQCPARETNSHNVVIRDLDPFAK